MASKQLVKRKCRHADGGYLFSQAIAINGLDISTLEIPQGIFVIVNKGREEYRLLILKVYTPVQGCRDCHPGTRGEKEKTS